MRALRDRPRRWVMSVGVALVGVIVASCAGVPTDGAIQRGPLIGVADDPGVIRVIARPPAPGMEPIEIVRGFLAANAGLTDVSIARQYLAPEISSRWDPADSISVIRGAVEITSVDDASFLISGALDGVVDRRGRWSVVGVGQEIESAITVAMVGGQWRISSVPDGLILTRTAAERALRTYALQFFDPEFRTLVPDAIVVPALGRGLATTLVRRLLEGPSDWLAPAVATAFPDGTRLAFESVPVVAGIAQIELTDDVLSADANSRRALSAQIVRTLAPVAGVSSVRITVAGTPLAIPGVGPVQEISDWAQFVSDREVGPPLAFGLANGRVVAFPTSGDEESVVLDDPRIAEFDVDSRGETVVGVTERRNTLVRAVNGVAETVHSGQNLASPQIVRGGIWVIERGVGVVSVTRSGSAAVPLTAEDGQSLDALVETVRVSPDGTRALVILRIDGRSRLLMARVEISGGASRLTGARRVESTFGEVLDASWFGASRLAVLTTSGAAGARLVTMPLGLNQGDPIEVPPGTTRVAASAGRALLIGRTDPDVNELLMRSAGRWVVLGGATQPVYP
jgi:hypothetical protein